MKKLYTFIIVAHLLILSISTLYAQNITVEGHVYDKSDKLPLLGVTVIVKGSQGSVGSLTDNDGRYSINIPAKFAQDTLLFTYIGYHEEQRPITNSSIVDVEMGQDTESIDEIVVVGYGTTTKKEVTGSVASLKADDLPKGAFTNAAGMLQGKVAGLTVTNPSGGDPNATFQIMLRGTNTLSAGQGPLIIIDGVADADLRNINFQEVESVDVLKDGSAAAIYGTRGTNGVVIITTKRAKSGTTSIEYDGQVSTQNVTSRAIPMTSEQFESSINTYKPAVANSLYGGSTDWFDEITRTPISHKHSVAISGGSEAFSHRTVLNMEQNQGIQRKNDVNKYLVRTNIHQTALAGWLDVDYNLSATKRKYSPANYDAFRQAFFHNPTEPVYDPENSESGDYYQVSAMDYYNPVAMIDERNQEHEYDNVNFSVRATLNVLAVDGLKWDNFISYNQERYEERLYRTSYYPSIIGQDGKASISNGYNNDLQWESTLNYKKEIGKHSIQGLLGYTYQEEMYQSSSMENYGFDNDLLGTHYIGSGSALREGLAYMYSNKSSSKYIAMFGRATYNYNDELLASASLRRDGSSRFGADQKWGWFPAVSVGWRLSESSMLEDASWINELKLRAGYGVTGNQDFSNYKSLLLMQSSTQGSYYDNGEWLNVYNPISNANPNLAWEKKSEYNVGLDFDFWGGRLSGSLDYYNRYTSNLLYNYSVPVPPYDYDVLFTNVGEIQNSGVELTLSSNVINRGKFQWNSTLTLANNQNKLISFTNEEFSDAEYQIGWLNTPIGVYCQRLIEGESLGTFYGPTFLYVDENGNDKLEGSIAGTVAESDWKPIGSAYPWLTYGWSNSFVYGNFDLGITLRGQLGGSVFNTYAAEYCNLSNLGLRNIMADWLNDTSFTATEVTYSSKYLEDASYLKIDNISFGYNVPIKKNKFMRTMRLYFSAQNVLCITGYSGVDPEVSLSGLTPGIESTSYYPRTATYTFGVNIKLN